MLNFSTYFCLKHMLSHEQHFVNARLYYSWAVLRGLSPKLDWIRKSLNTGLCSLRLCVKETLRRPSLTCLKLCFLPEPEPKYLHALMILVWTRKGKQYSVPQFGLATGVQTLKFFWNESLKPCLNFLYGIVKHKFGQPEFSLRSRLV